MVPNRSAARVAEVPDLVAVDLVEVRRVRCRVHLEPDYRARRAVDVKVAGREADRADWEDLIWAAAASRRRRMPSRRPKGLASNLVFIQVLGARRCWRNFAIGCRKAPTASS
ncbi:MAG: hypothetical protein RIS70_552 [Planctomycetota bacterium]